jgi:GTPase SAR1 family protein
MSKFFFNNFFNINSKKSFLSVEDWIRQCKEKVSPDCKFFLIGNKKDLEDEDK